MKNVEKERVKTRGGGGGGGLNDSKYGKSQLKPKQADYCNEQLYSFELQNTVNLNKSDNIIYTFVNNNTVIFECIII